MIAKVREVDFKKINVFLIDLSHHVSLNCEDNVLVSKIKAIVPEYISNNSVFEHLDAAKVVHLRD
jgi:hypothetical protein